MVRTLTASVLSTSTKWNAATQCRTQVKITIIASSYGKLILQGDVMIEISC